MSLACCGSGSDTEDPLPTAAFSRWEVGNQRPLSPLEANAPGPYCTFDITLLRHRSGLYGLSARLEWNREYRIFREQHAREAAPDTGAGPALAAERAVDPAHTGRLTTGSPGPSP